MCVDVVDKESSKPVVNERADKLRVAVAGLGLIGEGAALRLIADDNYVFCAALVRDVSKPRKTMPAGAVITDDVEEFLDARADIIIDALPDGGAGRSLIEKALARGVGIISANKQAVAGALNELTAIARRAGARFHYNASVGGGAPMIETVRRARAHGEIVEMTAILNGTVNYILTALADGAAFEDAVRRAQAAGFAEPDPTADLSGDDARAKLSILSYEAFGAEVDGNTISPVALDSGLARKISEDGGVFRQLASVKKTVATNISASVTIARVTDDDFFAGVTDEGNALRVVTSDGCEFTCADKGAGRAPTVDSLFADLETVRADLPPRQTN